LSEHYLKKVNKYTINLIVTNLGHIIYKHLAWGKKYFGQFVKGQGHCC